MKSFFPPNRQGIAIDVVVIVCNLIFFPPLATRIEALFSAFFGNDRTAFQALPVLMVFVLAGRLVGLYLKRFSLQARLADSEDGGFPIAFFIFSFPLTVLTAAFTLIALAGLAGDSGLTTLDADGLPPNSRTVENVGTFLILFLAALEAYLVYRLSRPLNPHEREMRSRGVWIYTWVGELAADFGLFVYMIIWQVFYHQIAGLLTIRADGQPMPWDMKLVSVFFMAICFALFYLAPRAVFLIEDRKYRGTWLMIGLVFLSSLRNLF